MHDKRFRLALYLQQRLIRALQTNLTTEWDRPARRFTHRYAMLNPEPEPAYALLGSLATQVRSLAASRNGAAAPDWEDESGRVRSTEDLLRRFERYVRDVSAVRPPVHRSDTVRTATQFIETHYADPITTATIARIVGRERTYFSTAFRRQTGQTIHRYIVAVRLRHAMSRLAQGEKVESAMLSAGYRSKRSFYRDFRTQLGATPGVFRDNLRR